MDSQIILRSDRLIEYHRSIANEFEAVKNRVRNLVDHWPSDGAHKEIVLRSVLKRHIPPSVRIGTGFIVDEQSSSTQIDILIVDGNKPTLFSDGDFMVVTPDCVKAVIEVKTSLPSGEKIKSEFTKLCEIGKSYQSRKNRRPWFGFFCFEQSGRDSEIIFDAFQEAYASTGVTLDGLAIGSNRFFRFKSEEVIEYGEDYTPESEKPQWREYAIDELSTSYFIGNVIEWISSIDQPGISRLWFPLPEGKHAYMRGKRLLEEPK